MNKEIDLLRRVAEQYQRDGYEVVLEPRGADLPVFLDKFRPDLIARGKHENVVVELRAKAELSTDHEASYIAALVNAQPGWRFDLVVTDHEPWPDEVPGDASERDAEEIRSLAETAGRLVSLGQLEAAYTIAWAAVEAAMREIADRKGIVLETKAPRFVVRTLYAEGVLSRSEFDELQKAMRIRNAVLHGLKVPELPPQTPAFLIGIVGRLLDTQAPRKNRKVRRVGSPDAPSRA